jgi:DNA-binding LacI/PurR family transcriptional regulator
MHNKPPTIKDIAQKLHLSISTVSRALRNAADINPETKRNVLELTELLNYQPNRLALSLRQKQTNTIGVIVPNLDYVLSTMVRGIDEAALEAGFTVIVCQSNESFGREVVNTRRMLQSLVDGYIISISSETKSNEHFKVIKDRNIPFVVFDRVIPGLEASSVILDNEEGGFLATEHLIEQGYKRIAILAGAKTLGISNSRLNGYKLALKKHALKFDPELVIYCDFNQDFAYFATEELLSSKKRPDAIFTISDRMAIGAMLAIKKKGLRMPDDIGLVGFNNEPSLALFSPSISSVEQPSFEIGKMAGKLFIEQFLNNDSSNSKEIILKPKLFIRESSLRLAKKL